MLTHLFTKNQTPKARFFAHHETHGSLEGRPHSVGLSGSDEYCPGTSTKGHPSPILIALDVLTFTNTINQSANLTSMQQGKKYRLTQE